MSAYQDPSDSWKCERNIVEQLTIGDQLCSVQNNLEKVDGKMLKKEFVVASPQQQEVISLFTTSSTKRHLLLEGPAGTGKTLVALQVANIINEKALENWNKTDKQPLLVLTACEQKREDPIMQYLVDRAKSTASAICVSWNDMIDEFGEWSLCDENLLHLVEELAKKWEGRKITMLVDEIAFSGEGARADWLHDLDDQSFPKSVRMILVLNPIETASNAKHTKANEDLILPPSFLQVMLTTPHRSTRAITTLSRFIAKCKGLDLPEGEIGSDVEGSKPIFFDVGDDEKKMEEALDHCRKHFKDNVTILYDGYGLPPSIESMVKKSMGDWECYKAEDFSGWEADKVVAMTCGGLSYTTNRQILEPMTRARNQLAVILSKEDLDSDYAKARKQFLQAADLGLVDVLMLSEILEADDDFKTTEGVDEFVYEANEEDPYEHV